MKTNVVCNPSEDSDFKRFAEGHVQLTGSPAELERRLRARYPAARVVEGISNGFGPERWYAYRDGHWISGDPRRAGAPSTEKEG